MRVKLFILTAVFISLAVVGSGFLPQISFPTAKAGQDVTVVIRPHDSEKPNDGNQKAHDTLFISDNDSAQGDNEGLFVGDGPSGTAYDGHTLHAIQAFDLAHLSEGGSIPANAIVKSATMRLVGTGETNALEGNNVYALVTATRLNESNGVWDEDASSWFRANASNRWATPGGDGDAALRQVIRGKLNDQEINNYFNFDVKALTQDAVENRGGNLQILMNDAKVKTCVLGVCAPFSLLNYFSYNSGEVFNNPDDAPVEWPRLTVTYTIPDPQEIAGSVHVSGTENNLPQAATVRLETGSNGTWQPAMDPVTHQVAEVQTTDTWTFHYEVNAHEAAQDYRVVVTPPTGFGNGEASPAYGRNCGNPSQQTLSILEWANDNRLSDEGCTANRFYLHALPVPPSPELVFCVRDTDTHSPLGNAQIVVPTSFIAPNPDSPDYLVTQGSTGCTHPTYLNYTALKGEVGKDLSLAATRTDYEAKTQSWQFKDQLETQTITIDMVPRELVMVDPASKQAESLSASQTKTRVQVGFTLQGTSQAEVKDVVVHESLHANLKLEDTSSIDVQRIVNGVGRPVLFTAEKQNDRHFSVTVKDTLGAGTYQLLFDVTYSGPAGTNIPVDQWYGANAQCNELSSHDVAYISYTSNRARSLCARIGQGSLQKNSPDPVNPSTTQEGKFIGRTIVFPTKDRLRSDITIAGSEAIKRNPPPLFSQFYLPSGEEIP